MSLARHNNGRFSNYHAVNDPVIASYNDVYSFLVKSPDKFELQDAIALHIFDLKLAESIRRMETNGPRMSAADIDRFIDQKFGTIDLEDVITKAKLSAAQYRKPTRRHRFWNVTSLGAWQGMCGNILSFMALLIIGLIVSALGAEPAAHVISYYNQCVRSLIPG